MKLKLERALELFFHKHLKQTIIHSLCFLDCSFTFDIQKTFVVLQFASPMTQKSLNLVKES